MSLRDHVICDSDLHVMEPPDLWERYIEPAYAHAAPAGLSELPRDMRVRVKNHIMLRMGTVQADARRRPQDRMARGARQRVRRVRGAGLERRVADRRDGRRGPRHGRALPVAAGCSCSASTPSEQIGTDGLEPAYASAIARAYNDWMKDFCDVAPDRMFGAGMVAPARRARRGRRGAPLRGGARLQGDLPRARPRSTADRGTTRPTTRCGPRSSGSTCRSRSTAAARPTSRPTSALEVLDKLMLWHTFSQPLGIQFVTACFCGGGVLERFPDLRVGAARGQLLVGALAALPPRRALRVDRLVRGARPHDAAVGVLQAQLLDLGRGRRGDRAALHRHVRRRTAGLLDRLPARRLEVPARGRRVRQAADVATRPRPRS